MFNIITCCDYFMDEKILLATEILIVFRLLQMMAYDRGLFGLANLFQVVFIDGNVIATNQINQKLKLPFLVELPNVLAATDIQIHLAFAGEYCIALCR